MTSRASSKAALELLKLLLDTHCWLWYLLSPDKLSPSTRDLLQESDLEVYLSVASAWEIVIKYDLGKLKLPLKPPEYVPNRLAAAGHSSLTITQNHVLEVANLPLHHRDPFDRVLIAQARVEGVKLVTADKAMTLYDVPLVWAGPTPHDSEVESEGPISDTEAE